MKTIFLVLCILFSCVTAEARDCYLKSAGSDLADGLTFATAYQTASKVLSSCSTSGDVVYINSGDMWNETLYTKTGVTYRKYGAGVNPKFKNICNFSSACNEQNSLQLSDIDVTLYDGSSWALTIRGTHDLTVDRLYGFSGGIAGASTTGIYIDDGASHEFAFPYNIAINSPTLVGWPRGIGGNGSNVAIVDGVVYNPGTNSAAYEMTSLASTDADADRFPAYWTISRSQAYCNDSRYQNNGNGERGFNIGYNAHHVVIDRTYSQNCGVAPSTGFSYSADIGSGVYGPNRISNNVAFGSRVNGLFVQTGAAATNPLTLGRVQNLLVSNMTFLAPTGTAPTIKYIDHPTEHTPAENLQFFNNIVLTSSASQCAISSTTTMDIESDYNLFWAVNGDTPCFIFNGVTLNGLAAWQAASGQDAHSKVANPLLNADFSIPHSSPARDAGKDMSAYYTHDYSGNARDELFDIGAWEHNGTTTVRGVRLINVQIQ